MATPLPTNRKTLKLFLRLTTEVLACAEPIRQQLEHQWQVIQRVSQQDFSDNDFFVEVRRALKVRIAGGGTDYHVLLDYLDSVPAPDLSVDLADVLKRLDSLSISPDEDRQQWKSRIVANLRKITLVRQQVHCFVQEMRLLQSKVIEHLERHEEVASVVAGELGASVAPDENVQQGRSRKKRTSEKKKGQTEQAIHPSVSFDEWAIGLDENRRWQIFERHGRGWSHQGPLPDLSKDRREWLILNAFAESHGSLTRIQLIKMIQPNFSNEEGVRIYNKMVKPMMTRLRARLRKNLGLGNKDPIPWDDMLQGYRLLITVGYSEKDDEHRPQFSTSQ